VEDVGDCVCEYGAPLSPPAHVLYCRAGCTVARQTKILQKITKCQFSTKAAENRQKIFVPPSSSSQKKPQASSSPPPQDEFQDPDYLQFFRHQHGLSQAEAEAEIEKIRKERAASGGP